MPDNMMAAEPVEDDHAIQEEHTRAWEESDARGLTTEETAQRIQQVLALATHWSEKRHSMTKEEYEYFRIDLRYLNAERRWSRMPVLFPGLEDVARRVNAATNEIQKPASFSDSAWRGMSDKDKDFARWICTENDRMDMEKGIPPKYYPVRPGASLEGQAAGGHDTVHTDTLPPLDAVHNKDRNTVQQPQSTPQRRNSQESATEQPTNSILQATAPANGVIDLVSPTFPPSAVLVNEDPFASSSTQARNAQDAAVDSQIKLDQRRQQLMTTPIQVLEPNNYHTPPVPQKSSGASRKSTPSNAAAVAGQATYTTPRAPSRRKAGADEPDRRSHFRTQAPPVQPRAQTIDGILAAAKADKERYSAFTRKPTQASQAHQLEAVEEQINRDKQMKHTAQTVQGAPQAKNEGPSMVATQLAQTQRPGNAASQGQAAPGPSHQMPSIPPQEMWNSPDLTPKFANVQQALYDQFANTPSSHGPQRTLTNGQQCSQPVQRAQLNARHQTPQPVQQLQRMQQMTQKAKEKERLRKSSNEIDPRHFEQMQRWQVQNQQAKEPCPAHVRSEHLQMSPQRMQAAQDYTRRMHMAQMRDVHNQKVRNLKRQQQNPNMVPAGTTTMAEPSADSSFASQQQGQMAQMQQSQIDHQQLQMGYQHGMQFNQAPMQMRMMGYQPSLQMNFPQQLNMGYQQQPQMSNQQPVPCTNFQQHAQMMDYPQSLQMNFPHEQMYFPQQPNKGFQQPVQSMSPQQQLVDQQSAQFMDHQQQLSHMNNQKQPEMGNQLTQMTDQRMAPSMGAQQPQMDFQQHQSTNDQQPSYFMGDQQQQAQPDFPQWTEGQLLQDLFPDMM